MITFGNALHVIPYKKENIPEKNASYLMEYWMILSSSIHVWKEKRPEKPVMATKIVKNWYY